MAEPGRIGDAHSEQNLAAGGLVVPQLGQTAARGAAHSMQNFAAGAFSVPHLEQTKPSDPSCESGSLSVAAARSCDRCGSGWSVGVDQLEDRGERLEGRHRSDWMERGFAVLHRYRWPIGALVVVYKLQDEYFTHVANVDRSELFRRLFGG